MTHSRPDPPCTLCRARACFCIAGASQREGLGDEAQAAITDDDVASHEAVGDEEGDRLRDIVGLSDPTDWCLARIVGEDRLPLLGRQEIPPRRLHDPR